MPVARTSRPWFSLLGAGAIVVLLLSVAGAAPAGAASGTYVRLAQLAESMTGAELLVAPAADPNRALTIAPVGYGGMSGYHLVDPGPLVVAVRGPGQVPQVRATVDAMPGRAYTLAVAGADDARTVTVLADDLTTPGPGQGRLRVIDAIGSVPEIEVRLPTGTRRMTAGTASGYVPVPAGTSTLTVGPPGGPGRDLVVPVGATQVVSVVLVGRNGTDGTARIDGTVHVDATGPVTVPPGPVDAGLGGTADPARAGVIALGGLAALGAAGTLLTTLVLRTRRSRS